MADQKVNIKVTAQGAKKAQRELNGVGGAISKMGKAVALASTAYFGAKGLIGAFSRSIELASMQQQAEKQLEFALGKTSTALLNQASALQKVTTFGDEAIISQQAFLASLDFTETQIKDIINASVDLSSATGITLESAVRNTAKTFSGLSGELGELIPQLRDLTKEEMEAGKAVEVMAGLFGGQAKIEAETMSGALQQARNSAGDLAEAIGNKLSPLVRVLATDFAHSTEKLKELIEPTEISDEDKLSDLLIRRKELMDGIIPKDDDTVKVDDFFNAVFNARGVTEEELFTPIDALNEEINKYEDLLFAKKPSLELNRAEFEGLKNIKKVTTENLDLQNAIAKAKDEQIKKDLRGAILSGQSAKQAMASVVRAETMEAVAGLLSSILKTVPYPLNLILGAGAGAVASSMMDNALAGIKAETGYEGVVTKPTLFLTGENNKPEQVSVTPLGGQSASGITVNISAPLVDETVVDSIIPAIERAKSLGTA